MKVSLTNESEAIFTHFPAISTERMAVQVTPSAEKSLRKGHPWLFDEGIASQNRTGQAGELAIIFGRKREFVALGLYDPDSPIRVKLLHSGSPKTIDRLFWRERIGQAWQKRQSIFSAETNAYRIIHGENDFLPALILDRYDESYVLKLYSAIWLPYLPIIVDEIIDLMEPKQLILRLGRRIQQGEQFGLRDGLLLAGEGEIRPNLFRENGLIFEADLIHGQKTGHFLDQRDNRQRVRQLAQGKTVLDVFACTGGFSLYAAAGGATAVTSIDSNPHALETAQRNFAHNRDLPAVAHCQQTMIVGDAFATLSAKVQRREQYDLVIIDPPAFAQKQTDIPKALQAYHQLAQWGVQLVRPNGKLVIASCSSRVSAELFFQTIQTAVSTTPYQLHDPIYTTHAPDHPVTFPEGAYLKAIFATVVRK